MVQKADSKEFMIIVSSKRNLFKAVAGVLLLLGIFAVPGWPGSVFDGLPFSTLPELLWIIVFCACITYFGKSVFASPTRTSFLVVLFLVLLLKVVVGSVAAPHGLLGEVVVGNSYAESFLSDRSTNVGGERKDIFSNIDFRAGATSIGHQTFPLAFINDSKRFNFIDDQSRKQLPWHFTLRGYLHVSRDEQIGFFLTSSGDATVYIDGKQELDVRDSKGSKEGNTFIKPAKGIHAIEVDFAYDGNTRPTLTLAWQLSDMQKKPIPFSQFYYEIPSALQLRINGLLSVVGWITDLGIFALSVLLLYRAMAQDVRKLLTHENARVLVVALIGLFILSACLWVYGLENDFRVLQAGNDDLLYESNARHILATGDWLLRVPEPGPYYYNVLYQYGLAVFHMIVGPDIALIGVLQIVLMVGSAIVAGRISKQLFGRGEIAVLIAVMASGAIFRFAHQFFPIGMLPFLLSIYLLLKWPGKIKSAVMVGALFGLLVILRTNFFSILPPILLWQLLSAKGRWKIYLPVITLFVAGLLIAPVTIRNIVVGGKAVLINTNLANNILIGNPIPETVDLSKVTAHSTSGVNIGIRSVVEYARQQPRDFIHLQWEKFLFYWGVRDSRHAWEVLLPSLLVLVWFVLSLIFNRRVLRRAWLPLSCIILMAATNIISIPWNIRYILPLIPLLLIFTIELFYYIAISFRRLRFGSLAIWSLGGMALYISGVAPVGAILSALIAMWSLQNSSKHDGN